MNAPKIGRFLLILEPTTSASRDSPTSASRTPFPPTHPFLTCTGRAVSHGDHRAPRSDHGVPSGSLLRHRRHGAPLPALSLAADRSPQGTKLQLKEDTPTQQQSLTLMRNLLRTSISSIAYLRGLFPEGATPQRVTPYHLHTLHRLLQRSQPGRSSLLRATASDLTIVGIGIKSLVPLSPNSTLLVKWLEDGVYVPLELPYNSSSSQVRCIGEEIRAYFRALHCRHSSR